MTKIDRPPMPSY